MRESTLDLTPTTAARAAAPGSLRLAALETAIFARGRGPRLGLLAAFALVALVDWRGNWLTLHGAGDRAAYPVWLVANAVTLLPIFAGVLAAGRAGRDRERSLGELRGSAVTRPVAVAVARFAGAAGPALLAALGTGVVIVLLAADRVGGAGAATAAEATLAMLVPAVVVATALGLLLGALLPVRAAQAAVAAIWVWALLGAVRGLPSIGHTPLDPTGTYAREELFHTHALMAAGSFHPALSSLSLALNFAALALIVAASVGAVAWAERPR